MENWKEVLEQVQVMVDRIYKFKEYTMYQDLDTMIKITKEFINLKLNSNKDNIQMDKINELILKLKSPFAREEINKILYK